MSYALPINDSSDASISPGHYLETIKLICSVLLSEQQQSMFDALNAEQLKIIWEYKSLLCEVIWQARFEDLMELSSDNMDWFFQRISQLTYDQYASTLQSAREREQTIQASTTNDRHVSSKITPDDLQLGWVPVPPRPCAPMFYPPMGMGCFPWGIPPGWYSPSVFGVMQPPLMMPPRPMILPMFTQMGAADPLPVGQGGDEHDHACRESESAQLRSYPSA
jgi:hypothetical protein